MRLDPVRATKEVIAPLVGGLLGMMLFPGLLLQVVRYTIPALALRRALMCTLPFFYPLVQLADIMHFFLSVTNVYPAIFVIAGFVRSAVVAYDVLSTWSQSVRDMEFLVELRLRNHEPDSEKGKEAAPIAQEPVPPAADAGSDPEVRQEVEDRRAEEAELNWDAGG